MGDSTMPAMFTIEQDYEFYVFLKSSLPAAFRIEAEPSTSYYSEWMFHYKLYHQDELLRTFEGDYRSLKKGALVRTAIKVLSDIETENRQC
jgi:hypothetical protein